MLRKLRLNAGAILSVAMVLVIVSSCSTNGSHARHAGTPAAVPSISTPVHAAGAVSTPALTPTIAPTPTATPTAQPTPTPVPPTPTPTPLPPTPTPAPPPPTPTPVPPAPTPVPPAPTLVPPEPTSPPVAPASGSNIVHPGAFCAPDGATGVTVDGVPMVCKTTAKDSRDRWRRQ